MMGALEICAAKRTLAIEGEQRLAVGLLRVAEEYDRAVVKGYLHNARGLVDAAICRILARTGRAGQDILMGGQHLKLSVGEFDGLTCMELQIFAFGGVFGNTASHKVGAGVVIILQGYRRDIEKRPFKGYAFALALKNFEKNVHVIVVVMSAQPCGDADISALLGVGHRLKTSHEFVARILGRLLHSAAVNNDNGVVAQAQRIEHTAVAAVITHHIAVAQ